MNCTKNCYLGVLKVYDTNSCYLGELKVYNIIKNCYLGDLKVICYITKRFYLGEVAQD